MDRVRFAQGDLLIDLSMGINLYECLSASGKTYLPQVAARYSQAPNIRVYNKEADYEMLLKQGFQKSREDDILFLDRFDLFGHEPIVKYLYGLKNVCILVDCKKNIYFELGSYQVARLERDGRRMRLYNENVLRRQ